MVRVYFENISYTVDEEGGPVIVCVLREGEIAETLTIQISTAELVPPQATGRQLSLQEERALSQQHYFPQVGQTFYH